MSQIGSRSNDKDFSSVKLYIDKISSPLLASVQIARKAP